MITTFTQADTCCEYNYGHIKQNIHAKLNDNIHKINKNLLLINVQIEDVFKVIPLIVPIILNVHFAHYYIAFDIIQMISWYRAHTYHT